MDPDNGLIGDVSVTELPQAPVDETALKELQNKVRYSRSKEYKELRKKADDRILFYQKFLPNGQPVGTTTREEMQLKWELANLIIAEFYQLFDEHENADALLKEQFGEQVLSP